MHEVRKVLNLLCYSNAPITVNIPKLHTALKLPVWLRSFWWKPLGVRRGAQKIWPAVVWAIILVSFTVATLPTHTGGNDSCENGTEMGVTRSQQCFNYALFSRSYPLLWSACGSWDTQGYRVMGSALCNKTSRFILWSEQYRGDLIKRRVDTRKWH